jgi:hypothetical protein
LTYKLQSFFGGDCFSLAGSVGPVFFLVGDAGRGLDEAGFADARAVFQSEIDPAAGIDVRAALTAEVVVWLARFHHGWVFPAAEMGRGRSRRGPVHHLLILLAAELSVINVT